MIRFRSAEDERRYNLLRAEIYTRLARNTPPLIVSEILRNFGKLESLLMMEGVRQGAAIVAIAAAATETGRPVGPEGQKAFQLHAMVYGSSDTPLRSVEEEWLERLGLEEDHLATGLLDAKPMRFAPSTLEESMGEQIGAAAAQEAPPQDSVRFTERDLARLSLDDDEEPAFVPTTPPLPDAVARAVLREEDDPADDIDAIQAPETLDRVRSMLLKMQPTGYAPASWHQLVLDLSIGLRIDAAFLDLQLSTPMGRTVLDQCGHLDVRPGYGIGVDYPTAGELPDVTQPSADDESR